MGDTFQIPERVKEKAYVKSMDEYHKLYDESVNDPSGFWGRMGMEQVSWFKKWDKVMEYNFHTADIKWFMGAKTNVSYNCLDRHLPIRGDKPAIIWEGNEPSESKTYTYKQLHAEVSKFANVLKKLGLKKGDTVGFYMPMIPELAIGMLACTRIGVIHSVVFGGFSADALKNRLEDAKTKVVITADGTFRGQKKIPLKNAVDTAVKDLAFVQKVVVVKRNSLEVAWGNKDVWWHELMASADADCPAEEMDAEDPLFILYTSGSTGKPKGVLHTTGGYLVYASTTHKYIFDYHEEDVYWCTADVGWITGHTYIVYGPLCNGATTIMFEGIPNYPDWGRFWDVVDKYKVTIFYTAPTAIRSIAREGDDWVKKHDLGSLRVLGSVGEPINPEAWLWYYNVVGHGRCCIVDTWWQTETGGILITGLPGATPMKPGSASYPFFGVVPAIVDDAGKELEGEATGNLCIKNSWPGQMRGVYHNQERFHKTYFAQFPGYYLSGDGCSRDADGYYWITGRTDDVIKVSGHRLGTAEIESALVAHHSVAEAAVVGMPHEIKGQAIYAYVILKAGVAATPELEKELVGHVRTLMGPIATPEKIQICEGLPKTRSGKIMRRVLRKIAAGESDFGDTSTLADPTIVEKLVEGKK